MNFKICLFDLDETLVRTDDLEDVRLACLRNSVPEKLRAVKGALASRPDRLIYGVEILEKLRETRPTMRLGIFTRSPRSYAETVLAWAYPGFKWDIIVAFEDVRQTKPHGEGIALAMETFGVTDPSEVMLIGDGDSDVRAAYNGGCFVVFDESGLLHGRSNDHWRALDHLPDAVIKGPDTLFAVFDRPNSFAPDLERLLSGEAEVAGGARFEKINHFVPREAGGDKKAYPVYVCGRSFAHYQSVQNRRAWHRLSHSIDEHKEADNFDQAWINAIRRFISSHCRTLFAAVNVLVTVVPRRPGRKARLEALVTQLMASVRDKPLLRGQIAVAPELLAFKDGVRSQHNDRLDHLQRYENVRDHLYVKTPELLAKGVTVLVLDDVVTTGASLICASNYLREAGATDIKCLAIAKNISDVL